ncbi:MAG: DHHW family protein [Proteocatella sp.]
MKLHFDYKKFFKPLGIIFILFLLLVSSIGIVSKDKQFSENENRVLSQIPKLSIDNIISGRFSKKFEKYCVDQFPGRNNWVALKTNIDLYLGKKEENNIYIGSDHYLIEKFEAPEDKYVNENIEAINNFITKYKDINSYFMLVPNATDILSEKLPEYAPAVRQHDYIADFYSRLDKPMQTIDLHTTFNDKKDDDLFYRTDHHWTSTGAFYAFSSLAENMKLKVSDNYYDKILISENFYGTLASKVGFYDGPGDKIQAYIPKDSDDEVIVSYVEEKTKSPSLYDSTKLDSKNKYEVFLKGNHPLVKIKTTAKNHKTLLVIKDSYANCFIPFLTPYFSNIIVLDPRYYYDDIYNLMEGEQVSDILFLYNANTFFNDSFLSSVLNND